MAENKKEEKKEEKREQFVSRFSVGVSVLSFAAVVVITGIQIYVRWFINQTFTIIGGSQLEVLTISTFILIAFLSYIHRQEKK